MANEPNVDEGVGFRLPQDDKLQHHDRELQESGVHDEV
jgi:hypothetical protein